MATIYNSDLSKELVDGAKIQQNWDKVPNVLGQTVVPVMEVNPKLLRRCNILRRGTGTNATSTTIYIVPSDKDFYLVSCSLSIIKDATSTSLYSRITCIVDGVTASPIVITGLTLTIQNEAISISFPIPIKIDRGTTISLDHSTNVANISGTGCIIGYTISD